MHIPDTFIPISQCAVYWLIAFVFIALSLVWVARQIGDDDGEKVPLLAVLAAGIFALQFFNIPVPLGTSVHFLGAALVAIVLGSPYAAVFILSLVLIVQGFLFGDGGLTTMGANIINMGVIGGFVGYYGYVGLLRLTKSMLVAAAGAAWLACFIPAIATALELAAAGQLDPTNALMALYYGSYALNGILEAGITAVVLNLIANVRPDILDRGEGAERVAA